MPTEIKFSPSRVKDLLKCSLLFYYAHIQRWQTKTWPKTHAGSCVHSFLECLTNPRHKRIYDHLIQCNRITIYSHPVLTRFVRGWMHKTGMSLDIAEPIGGMLEVALIHTDFFFKTAKHVFPPEMEFQFKVGDATLKGIIDRCADMGDRILCRDYKSQGKVFTPEELRDNLQAIVYQLALYEKYGKPVDLEFIMLRFPPNKKDANRHVQRCEFPTLDHLEGLKMYIEYIYQRLNNFTEQDAHTSYCEDEGFCKRVCTFYAPRDYLEVVDKKTGEVTQRYMVETPPKDLDLNKYSLRPVRWNGCPARWKEG